MTQYISYLRVSTQRQGQSGLGLDAQHHMVQSFIMGSDMLGEYIEIESGRKNHRPELNAALAHCRRTKATLVIAKLDRLARDAVFLLQLMKSEVNFVACDMPEANKVLVGIMAIMAEAEADAISTRTREALARSKKPLGFANPLRQKDMKASQAKGHATQQQEADQHAQRTMFIIGEIKNAGITSLKGIATALNARGIATQRGGKFYPTTVRNIMKRVSA